MREKGTDESWSSSKARSLYHHNCGTKMRADSVHVRHASVEVQVHCVNVVIGVVLGELLVVRVVPVFVCDAAVHRTLVLIAKNRSHCFHVAFFFT